MKVLKSHKGRPHRGGHPRPRKETEMTIRFRDYRNVEGYGKEVYTTNSPEEARQYMRQNEKRMRFLTGGGITRNGELEEIYWDIVSR